jgi:hypothetical protein
MRNPVVWDSAFCADAHHFWARIEGSALQGPWNLVFFPLFLSWDKSCVGLLCGAHSELFDDGSNLLIHVFFCSFLHRDGTITFQCLVHSAGVLLLLV